MFIPNCLGEFSHIPLSFTTSFEEDTSLQLRLNSTFCRRCGFGFTINVLSGVHCDAPIDSSYSQASMTPEF